MDGGAWWAAVHGVTRSQTRLSNFPFTFHFHVLEKEMATHSSVLAWRISGTGEPGGLLSMGLHRVGQDRSNLAAAGIYRSVRGRMAAVWPVGVKMEQAGGQGCSGERCGGFHMTVMCNKLPPKA